MIQFAVLISTGWPTNYSRKVGWDHLHATRAEAEDLAVRAERNSGWSAKVISLSEREAAVWNETVDDMLKRRREELDARIRQIGREP